jgi:hypothetical protein
VIQPWPCNSCTCQCNLSIQSGAFATRVYALQRSPEKSPSCVQSAVPAGARANALFAAAAQLLAIACEGDAAAQRAAVAAGALVAVARPLAELAHGVPSGVEDLEDGGRVLRCCEALAALLADNQDAQVRFDHVCPAFQRHHWQSREVRRRLMVTQTLKVSGCCIL